MCRQATHMAPSHSFLFRKARPADAEDIARIYVESWHDTYPGLLPAKLLLAMTVEGQAARWRNAIALAAREGVYVVEDGQRKVAGMISLGRGRDQQLGFDAEVYTLYVDILRTNAGIGRVLMRGAFGALAARGHSSCVIWAHAKNPARFFYEAMGGVLVAERTVSMLSMPVPEVAYGWTTLALAETSRAR